MLTSRAPSGGTKGTTVNHIGFSVPNVRAAVDKAKAAGYPIVTRAELPPTQDVKDDLAFIADQKTSIAFVMGPDDTKVELVENKGMTGAIALHHIHFAASERGRDASVVREDVQRASRRTRGSFQAADLPGVNLNVFARAGSCG